MRVGVVAPGGSLRAPDRLPGGPGVRAVLVARPADLAGCRALVMAGGDSEAAGPLMARAGLLEPVRRMGREGVPLLGMGAGMALLAREVEYSNRPRVGLMNIGVSRPANGGEGPFVARLSAPVLGPAPVRAVFNQAPQLVAVGPGVEVLAQYRDQVVLVRQGNLLAAAFEPGLTAGERLYRYFLRDL